MTLIKEYQYKERSQRFLCYIALFVLNFLFGFYALKSAVIVKTLFFYSDMFKHTVLFFLALHLTGIVVSMLIFRLFKRSRPLFLISGYILVALNLAFFVLIVVIPDIQYLLADLWVRSFIVPVMATALIPLFSGFMNNYYLKILSGKFFDEKKGAHFYILFLLAGLFLGSLAFSLTEFYSINALWWLIAVLALALLTAFIKLEYMPVPFIAREFGDSHEADPLSVKYRDDLVFNYLNFSYLIIFCFLGLQTAIRFFGDFLYIKLVYLSYFALFLIAGYVVAILIRRAYWHIYSQMLYPLFFIFFFIMVQRFSAISFIHALLFAGPLAFSFGMSLYHSIRAIADTTEQSRSHVVIGLSLFIIPIPLIIALTAVTFSNRLFFVFLYLVSFGNFLLPGIHLSQRKNTHYRKGLYFTLLTSLLPLIILAHVYYGISFDRALFVQHTRNFDSVYRANSNADYYDFEEDIFFNDHKVMIINDMYMRNLRRCVFTLSFFHGGSGDEVLFIDGVKKFVENKAYELFPDAVCLDYVPENKVDYNNPPVSGSKSVITIKDDVLNLFRKRASVYSSIVDIPNIYDQNVNGFKFSEAYYSIVKNHLVKDGSGLYMQILQPIHARPAFVNNALVSLAKTFSYVVVLDYGDTVAYIASDNKSHFELRDDRVSRLRSLFESNERYRLLFIDEAHCLSYFVPVNVQERVFESLNNFVLMLSEKTETGMQRFASDEWLQSNNAIFREPFYSDGSERVALLKDKMTEQNSNILNLKKAEFADCSNDYISESYYLSLLQKEAEYNFDIRHYLEGIIEVKEKTYLALAEKFEDTRQWSKAREVYLSILNLQNDSFDANYRLGMIFVTLQDFSSANRFLQRAMELQSDNPRVLYQMGVLLYARGDIQGAVNYFERAILLKYDSSQIYFFLGISYEVLGRLNDAKRNLEIADKKDPQNQDIKSALNRVNRGIDDSQYRYEPILKQNDRESEQGESVPLPVNRNARESRITDEELSRYSVAQKGEGSEYAEKFAKDPGTRSTSDNNKEEGFFDLFRGPQQ